MGFCCREGLASIGPVSLLADEVVVTNGALEAFNLCLTAVTRPGDVVAVESPGFYAALQAIERLDLRAVEIPVHPISGLDLDALAAALDKHPIRACWFMTNFQNPTGVSLSDEKKKALVEMLAAREVPLIEDDVYEELHFSRERPRPAKAFDTSGLVMHCSSFSKTLAPGYRIGWAAAGRFADRVKRLKLMTTLSSSIPAQASIADYLEYGGYDRHLRELRAAMQTQLASMEAALRRYLPHEVQWVTPRGGYFLWLQLPQLWMRWRCTGSPSSTASASHPVRSSRPRTRSRTACVSTSDIHGASRLKRPSAR
jgi:DNA-binding transcriptional MocR family regulator